MHVNGRGQASLGHKYIVRFQIQLLLTMTHKKYKFCDDGETW